MQAAPRLGLAFLLLIAAFLVLVGVAVGTLFIAGQGALALVVVVAGIAGVGAGVVTWLLVRNVDEEPAVATAAPAVQPLPHAAAMPRPARRAPRVQAMPVADLPPAYVNAVTRGIRARTSALRGQPPPSSA